MDDLMTSNTKDKRRTTEDNFVILKPGVRVEGKLASAGKGGGDGDIWTRNAKLNCGKSCVTRGSVCFYQLQTHSLVMSVALHCTFR